MNRNFEVQSIELDKTKMEKSVFIILNYKDFHTTKNYVNMILPYKIIYKIIIVDNASPDGSFDYLSKIYKQNKKVDVIKTVKNRGYAIGNNFGMRYAIKNYNPYYFFISNPDIIMPETTVKKIMEFNKANKNKKIGMITGIIVEDRKDTTAAWKLPRFKDDILLAFDTLLRIFGNPIAYSRDYLFSNNAVKVEVIPGSFFCINKEAIVDVGLFDENTFLYYEETILAYKLIEKGYDNYLLTTAKYFHLRSLSIDQNIGNYKKKYSILQKSRAYYHERYLNISIFKKYLYQMVTYLGGLEKIMICFLKQIL